MSTISSSYFISSLITRRSGKSAQIIWNPTLYNMDALTSENSYLKTFYAVISMKNLSQKNLLNFGLNSRYNAFTHWSTETHNHKSSVIRQRVNLETGVSRKQSTPYIPKNEHFLPHNTHMYVSISGGKKYSFFGKFSVLCFLENPFWDLHFCLITDAIEELIGYPQKIITYVLNFRWRAFHLSWSNFWDSRISLFLILLTLTRIVFYQRM